MLSRISIHTFSTLLSPIHIAVSCTKATIIWIKNNIHYVLKDLIISTRSRSMPCIGLFYKTMIFLCLLWITSLFLGSSIHGCKPIIFRPPASSELLLCRSYIGSQNFWTNYIRYLIKLLLLNLLPYCTHCDETHVGPKCAKIAAIK